MPKINLLPSDLLPKKSITKLANILTKISYASIAIFLLFILTILGIFIINSSNINKIKTQEDELINIVKQYEQTEQQIVLAKDRIEKILKIWEKTGIQKHLSGLEKLLELSSGVSLNEMDISSSKSEISLNSMSSLSVSQFMSSLVLSDIYKFIKLKNFSYNPNYGYRITFEANF
ncbi:MAG: hypothetical protein ABIJ05_02585 [Patescibacteria group bacterium]